MEEEEEEEEEQEEEGEKVWRDSGKRRASHEAAEREGEDEQEEWGGCGSRAPPGISAPLHSLSPKRKRCWTLLRMHLVHTQRHSETHTNGAATNILDLFSVSFECIVAPAC